MKRFIIVFAIVFTSFSYAQDYQDTVVALEVTQESSNSAIIRWKSNLPEGKFSVYYHTSLIKNEFVLYDAEIIISTNFAGELTGSQYIYEYKMTFQSPGDYFFAVIQNDTKEFDRVARSVITDAIPQYNNIRLIPEINITTQPISVRFRPQSAIDIQKQKVTQPVITSLELTSSEDMFHLRWSAYPKDLSEYVFVIYRSRFPIIQYGSPEGLPEYTRVTNQFSIIEKNIEFENPYYYAVIIEGSIQWDSGINVFTQPAVLLRESPPLRINPVAEYVKTKRVLSLNTNEFTEEEMELAVQQTLSNLYDPRDIMYTGGESYLSMNDSSSDDLQMISGTLKTDNKETFNGIIYGLDKHKNEYIHKEEKLYKNLLANLDRNQKKYIADEYQNFSNITKSISALSNDIKYIYSLESNLLVSDRLSTREFQKQLNDYYDKIDQLRIAQYRVRGSINTSREHIFLSNQYALRDAFIRDVDKLKQEYYQKLKVQSLAINVTLQAEKADNFEKEASRLQKNTDMESNLANIRISKEIEYMEGLLQKNEGLGFQNDGIRDVDSYIQEQLVKAQSYYNIVTVEKIPDISEISNEKWLPKKEAWLNSNKEIWISKNALWQRRIEEILGRDYHQISSKWMTPSQTVALQEGKKAFLRKDYKEAVYLLYFVTKDHNALMALGQSYYHLGAYRDAFSVFITALHMDIPESRYWINRTSAKILDRNL